MKQFLEDRQKLNLKLNHDGLLEFCERIQGVYAVYVPDNAIYTEKLVKYAHEATLYGRVRLTMARVCKTH